MSAKERTSTGCSDQGALRLKHKRPNEHSAMSAKPAIQTADPTFATSQVAPDGARQDRASLPPAWRPAGTH